MGKDGVEVSHIHSFMVLFCLCSRFDRGVKLQESHKLL